VAGYCVSNYINAKKSFVFYGPPNSGKSIFLRLMNELVGSSNVSNVTLPNLNDERYLYQLKDKRLNISNELPSSPMKDLGMFKMLTSGNDTITFRRMRENPTSEICRAKLLFGSNHFPVLALNEDEDIDAFFSRIVILPFLNEKADKEQDKNLFDKLKTEIDYIFMWALKGLSRFVENGFRFSKCDISDKYLKQYIAKYNPAKVFIEKHVVFDELARCSSTMINNAFCDYCNELSIDVKPSHLTGLSKSLVQNPDVIKKRLRIGNENVQGYKGIQLKI